MVRSEAERSFHVFYQLLVGGGALKGFLFSCMHFGDIGLTSCFRFVIDELLLAGSVEDYDYLNKSRREVDGVNDKEEWNELKVHSQNMSMH